MSDHLVLHPQLATGNFIIKAIWLPGSQTELAIITADFVKVYSIFYIPVPFSYWCWFNHDFSIVYYYITVIYSWQRKQQSSSLTICRFSLTDLWLVSGCSEPHVLLSASKFQDTWCNFSFQWRREEHYHHHVFSRIHVHPAHGWIKQCSAWSFLCYQCVGNNPWRPESNQKLITKPLHFFHDISLRCQMEVKGQ